MFQKNFLAILIIFLCGLFAVKSLFHQGFYTSHDGEHQIIRLNYFEKALKDGQIPPVWAGEADNKFGYPLFAFSYHLPFWIGLFFRALHFSLEDSIKVVSVIGYLFSGFFMYFFLRKKLGSFPALFSSLLYLYAPYRFSNILVRASLGEATVFMFYPLLFWGIEQIAENEKNKSGILFTMIGLSGIILSHLMGLIIIAIPLILWIFLKVSVKTNKRILLGKISLAIFLGIMLSSFYLIPAIWEKKYTIANESLITHFRDHFVTLSQLIYSRWGYGFDFLGTENDAMSLQIGLTQWLIVLFSVFVLISIILRYFKNKKSMIHDSCFMILIYSIFIFLYSILMMLPLSTPVWEFITKYSYFDFPWRFLGLSVFISALCGGYLINFLIKLLPFNKHVIYCLSLIFLLCAFYTNRNHLNVNQYISYPDSYYAQKTNTTNMYDEYRPKSLNSAYIEKGRSRFLVNYYLHVDSLRSYNHLLMVEGSASKQTQARVNISYFPGWKVYLGSKEVKPRIIDGVMELNLNPGKFNLRIVFENTWIRLLGIILTIISIIILLIISYQKNSHFLLKIIIYFTVWRLFLFIIISLSQYFLPVSGPTFVAGNDAYFKNPYFWSFSNMDGLHYLSIAKIGYIKYEQAFFPFYPLMIKYLSIILGQNYLLASYIISHIFFFLTLVVFYSWIKQIKSEKEANWSIIFLLIFPTSFFFAASYTESLFLFLVIASFYASYKHKYFLSGILGGVASLTRLAGIFLFPALLVELWLRNHNTKYANTLMRKHIISICLIPLGLLSYMFYLWRTVGDPLYFFHAQPSFGANRSGDKIILLPQVVYRYFKIMLTTPLNYEYLISVLELISLIFTIYFLIKYLKKIPLSWQIFSWLCLLVPTLTGSLSSLPRYLLTIFPLYYLLSLQSRIVKYILIILFIILQIILGSYYLRGYFVA